MDIRKLTLDEFHAELKAQGVAETLDLAFKCVVCGTVQSARTLICVSAGKDFEAVSGFLGFSCAGRWTAAGPYKEKGAKGLGCDWTLGGLFSLHTLTVDDGSGTPRPCFEPATPEEAQALAARAGRLEAWA
jgi:hypothetical protein